MTDKINEQVSALIDGELPESEGELLQRRLMSDETLQGTWQRYHLIRDALREDLPEFISTNHDVDLGDEATAGGQAAALDQNRFTRPLAGMAIAASVAMMAVVVVMNTGTSNIQPDNGLAASGNTGSSHGVNQVNAQTVASFDSYQVVPRSGWQSAKPAVVSHLNGYLVDHSNYAGLGSAQSILPYARIAGYDEPLPDDNLKENAKQNVAPQQ